MPTHDVDGARIAWVGAGLALTVVLAVVAVFVLLDAWNLPASGVRGLVATPPRPPGPALQSAPQPDLARDLAGQRHVLETGGWVDPQRGIVRLPIATAMALLASAPRPVASQPEVAR